MNEQNIQEFWSTHPCDEALVGGLTDDYEEFFNRYDTFRYKRHSHLLRCLDAFDFRNKRVLEIGLGLGADSEQIIRRGAIWNGIDLTSESIDRVTRRLSLRNLPYEHLKVANVCSLPFNDNSFDIVYSHGVLHHVPNIRKAQTEIHRVLKPDGLLVAMLYAKNSLNYWVSISLLRRLALMLIYLLGLKTRGIVAQHMTSARQAGLFCYLRMANFIHRNTDGPLNPYTKVYNLSEVRKDFPDFRIAKAHKEFMWAPPLPVSRLPMVSLLGWHLWVHMNPVKK
jgi:ubiquinone/menaquinone biosynthesis C-methylase UbiE